MNKISIHFVAAFPRLLASPGITTQRREIHATSGNIFVHQRKRSRVPTNPCFRPSETKRRRVAYSAKVMASSGVNDRERGERRGVLARERHPFILPPLPPSLPPSSLPVSLPSFPPPDDSIASPEEYGEGRTGGKEEWTRPPKCVGRGRRTGRDCASCRVATPLGTALVAVPFSCHPTKRRNCSV